MSPFKTILFDLGNVVAYIDFGAFWRDLGFRPEEMADYTEGYTSWTKQYETGLISTETYLNNMSAVFNQKYTAKRIEEAFRSIIRQPVEGIEDLIERVSRTHQTALVSNTNEIHHTYSRSKIPALRLLPKHYVSYQLRVMKPARGFYDAIIRDQKIFPSQLLFIDDLAENVKAATYAGMKAVRFEGAAHLETQLIKIGVL